MAVPSSHGSSRSVAMSGTATMSPYPLVPVGEAVAGERLHVDVDGEEVVARLDAVLEDVVEEEAARDPLADRPSLHVGKAPRRRCRWTRRRSAAGSVAAVSIPARWHGAGCRPARRRARWRGGYSGVT